MRSLPGRCLQSSGELPMRIALIDDQPLVRNGIASLLEARGFEVVAEASNGQEGMEAVRRTRAELGLMDVRMPVMDGVGGTRLRSGAVTVALICWPRPPQVIVSERRAARVRCRPWNCCTSGASGGSVAAMS